jgi:hypothetical protein
MIEVRDEFVRFRVSIYATDQMSFNFLVLYRCLPTALGLDQINSTNYKQKLEDGIT